MRAGSSGTVKRDTDAWLSPSLRRVRAARRSNACGISSLEFTTSRPSDRVRPLTQSAATAVST